MAVSDHATILVPEDGPAAEVINPRGRGPVCLVCEHASAFIPSSLEGLGLAEADRYSHAVWDIGALELARTLSAALDAPLLASRVSRVVYDCNRPPEAPDAIPSRTERIAIPGNAALTAADKSVRVQEIYEPFRQLLTDFLDGLGGAKALMTVHSFTPVWFDTPREVELGLLHDADERLALRMFAAAEPGLVTRLNEPYSAADGVTHTLALHGVPRGLENVMVEVRNDLLSDAAGVARIAGVLTRMVTAAMAEGARS